MVTREYTLVIDFKSENKFVPMKFVQGDHNTCRLNFSMPNEDLTGLHVRVVFKLSDGTHALHEAEITGATEATMILPSGVLTVQGAVNCQVSIYNETDRLTHPVGFSFSVVSDLSKEAIEASDQFPILTELVQLFQGIEATEGGRVEAEEGRVLAEALRVMSESNRQNAESDRSAAEGLRNTAEIGRTSVESSRASAETNRTSAEGGRVNAESLRSDAENARASAEFARNSAEDTRASAESARVTAENTRSSNESNRVSAENARVAAEAARVTVENVRAGAEDTRVANENIRANAEGNRAFKEDVRVIAETARQGAETARANAESARATAEGNRVSAELARVNTENGRAANESARANAESDRVNAEHLRHLNELERELHEINRSVFEPYDRDKAYLAQQKVVFEGSSYTAIRDVPPQSGPENPYYWLLIAQKGEVGQTGATGQNGIGLEYNWNGTELGVKRENGEIYQYSDLKGNKGDTGNSGVYRGPDEPTDSNVNVWVDEGGDPILSAADLIPITDAGNYFSEKNVEAALQETRKVVAMEAAEKDAELKSLQLLLQNANVNQESRQQIVDAAEVVSLPKTAGNGGMPVVLGGMTAKNEVVNGDFSQGTAGWINVNSTLSAMDDTLKITATGSTATNVSASQPHNFVAGNKYYTRAIIKVPDGIANVKVRTSGVSNVDLIPNANPQVGIFTLLSSVVTITAANSLMYIRTDFPDVAAATGKVTEVKEVLLVDLTATFGAGSEPDLATCDKLFATFDGLKSVVAPRVRSVGKNLFDKSKHKQGYRIMGATGAINDEYAHMSLVYVPVKPSTNYCISGASYYNNATSTGYAWLDENKNVISSSTYSGRRIAPEGGSRVYASPVRAMFLALSVETESELSTLQVEIGEVATAYAPYTESLQYCEPVTLRRLPNGVRDTVEGGKSIFRTKKTILQANNITNLTTNESTCDFVVIKKPLDSDGYGKTSVSIGEATKYMVSGFVPSSTQFTVGAFTNRVNGTDLLLFVARGTYANLVAAKAALTGTELIYQVTTPEVTDHITSGVLTSEPSGTVYLEHALADAGMYTDKLTVLRSGFPIHRLESIHKVDPATGGLVPLYISEVVVAGDGLSFTHPGLSTGDIVFFVYHYAYGGPNGENSYSVYDSRYTIKDSVTSKYYKWGIGVANGVPSINLVEV